MCTMIISENLQSCVTITIYQSENTSIIPECFLVSFCSWSPLLPLIPDNPYLLSVTTNLPFPDILSLQILIAIIFYLSIHSCLIISSLLLLWVRFLWPFTHKFLCGRMVFVLLGIEWPFLLFLTLHEIFETIHFCIIFMYSLKEISEWFLFARMLQRKWFFSEKAFL